MAPDVILDVAIAPEAALARISRAINRRSKRMFGVLKTENEYVGVVADGAFEIWERQQRAVHAVGRVSPTHGGSRIELHLVVPLRTWVLIVVFFVLYVVVAVGISLQPPEPEVSARDLAISVAGAATLVGIFAIGARRQGAALRAFVDRLFADLPRV